MARVPRRGEAGDGGDSPALIPPPSLAERRVDVDEDEKGPAEERLERRLVVDVGDHPSLAPALGHELEEGVGRGEGEVVAAPDRGAAVCERGGGGGVLGGGCGRSGEGEEVEAVLLD